MLILHTQCYSSWCPDNTRGQDISSYDIDLAYMEYSSLSHRVVNIDTIIDNLPTWTAHTQYYVISVLMHCVPPTAHPADMVAGLNYKCSIRLQLIPSIYESERHCMVPDINCYTIQLKMQQYYLLTAMRLVEYWYNFEKHKRHPSLALMSSHRVSLVIVMEMIN